MTSFDNQNPTPIRPSGQASCFQVAETPHELQVILSVPWSVIDFFRSFFQGVANLRTVLKAHVANDREQENRAFDSQRRAETRIKETLRQGRILASSLRHQRRDYDLSRNDTLNNLADAFRLPVKQAETFIKLYTRHRDDRIEQSRIDIARRCHTQGMSLSDIGVRLNVSKSTAHRIMENIKKTDDV